MRMELIQPFINAADAVFAESLQAPTKSLIFPWKKRPTGERVSLPSSRLKVISKAG